MISGYDYDYDYMYTPPVSFWLKTWIWQGHHLGSRMARVE